MSGATAYCASTIKRFRLSDVQIACQKGGAATMLANSMIVEKAEREAMGAEQYGNRCYELDAMNPNGLRERVAEQIETYLDLPAWERSKDVEQAEVASMQEFHSAWNARLRLRKSISGPAHKYSPGAGQRSEP